MNDEKKKTKISSALRNQGKKKKLYRPEKCCKRKNEKKEANSNRPFTSSNFTKHIVWCRRDEKKLSCTNNKIIHEIDYYVYLPLQWCSVSHFMWVFFSVCSDIHRLAINKIEKQELRFIQTEWNRKYAHQTHNYHYYGDDFWASIPGYRMRSIFQYDKLSFGWFECC